VADRFSIDATPEMRARDSATRRCVTVLRSAVAQISQAYGLDSLDLRVEAGGRRTNYSPVAWVRIYSAAYSPSATEGFYLVYLFAADGSRVYLSLNQGTSEYRAGKKRPVTDSAVLAARATEARAEIDDLADSELDGRGYISIDLAWQQLRSVGSESRRRIRNYEDGNVLAYEYRSGQIPTDDQLIGTWHKSCRRLHTFTGLALWSRRPLRLTAPEPAGPATPGTWRMMDRTLRTSHGKRPEVGRASATTSTAPTPQRATSTSR
jgi:hypothetical protein